MESNENGFFVYRSRLGGGKEKRELLATPIPEDAVETSLLFFSGNDGGKKPSPVEINVEVGDVGFIVYRTIRSDVHQTAEGEFRYVDLSKAKLPANAIGGRILHVESYRNRGMQEPSVLRSLCTYIDIGMALTRFQAVVEQARKATEWRPLRESS